MASSVGGQDGAISCPLGSTTGCVPREKFPQKPNNKPFSKWLEPFSISKFVLCNRPGEGSSEKNCCW